MAKIRLNVPLCLNQNGIAYLPNPILLDIKKGTIIPYLSNTVTKTVSLEIELPIELSSIIIHPMGTIPV